MTALVAIGIKPLTANLPVYACLNKTLMDHINNRHLDWPSMLVYFGCCILILFKKFTSEENK